MPAPHDRLREKLAELAYRKSERKIEAMCEQHDGIKCSGSAATINGMSPEDHRAPFTASSSKPFARIGSSMDYGIHRDWMRQQLQLLGEGVAFFVAIQAVHPGWVGLSCEKGLEKLVDFALGLSSGYSLSLYNPSSGEGIYLQLREYETLCFKNPIGPQTK